MWDSIKTIKLEKYLLLIFSAAAILRLWGIWHGYPYSFYPDEAHFVKRALSFGSGDLNPHWFHKPAFLMYLLFFDYGLLFVVGKIAGFWNSVTDFAVFYVRNPGPFYMLGRFTIVLFSLGSVLMTYLAGKNVLNKRVGLFAAFMLAVSFGHVYATKDIKADIPCGFFTILSAYYLIGFLKKKSCRKLFLSAVCAGVGAATKTYSIVMIAPIVFGAVAMDGFDIFTNGFKKIKIIICCILFFLMSYFICSPYNFIDPLGREATFKPIYSLYNKVERVVSGQKIDQNQVEKNIAQNIENSEVSLTVYINATISYLKVMNKGVGIVALIASIAGLLSLLVRRDKLQFVGVLLFPALFAGMAIFTSPGYSEVRHQVVIYPFVAIIAAVFVVQMIQSVGDKYVWIFVCLLFYPIYGIVLHNMEISSKDTRNISKSWIEKNIPADTKVLINENGPQLNASPKQLSEAIQKAKKADPKGQFTAHFARYLEYQRKAVQREGQIGYQLSEIRLPWWKEKEEKSGVHPLDSERDKDMGNPLRPVGVHPYDYYVKNEYQYVIVQSEEYHAFLDPKSVPSINFPSFRKFYSQLFEKGILIKEFIPQKGRSQGPVVKIFKIR